MFVLFPVFFQFFPLLIAYKKSFLSPIQISLLSSFQALRSDTKPIAEDVANLVLDLVYYFYTMKETLKRNLSYVIMTLVLSMSIIENRKAYRNILGYALLYHIIPKASKTTLSFSELIITLNSEY